MTDSYLQVNTINFSNSKQGNSAASSLDETTINSTMSNTTIEEMFSPLIETLSRNITLNENDSFAIDASAAAAKEEELGGKTTGSPFKSVDFAALRAKLPQLPESSGQRTKFQASDRFEKKSAAVLGNWMKMNSSWT